LSRTHALAVDIWFPNGKKHDAAWYTQRLDILKRIAENVVVTDQSP
jgi:ubiquinone biosynthesis protein COQ9